MTVLRFEIWYKIYLWLEFLVPIATWLDRGAMSGDPLNIPDPNSFRPLLSSKLILDISLLTFDFNTKFP